jgi:hypothetical protein
MLRTGGMIQAQTSIVAIRRFIVGAGVVLLVASLQACAAISEHATDTALISPGKFEFYSCQDIADRAKTLRIQQVELEQLMDRSAQGVGGEFINAIAYRSNHAQTTGELKVLAQVTSDKKCATESKWSSGRSVF